MSNVEFYRNYQGIFWCLGKINPSPFYVPFLQEQGRVVEFRRVGGLRHKYGRMAAWANINHREDKAITSSSCHSPGCCRGGSLDDQRIACAASAASILFQRAPLNKFKNVAIGRVL